MLRIFEITYIVVETTLKPPQHHTVEVKAYSKYNAKKRFYRMYPQCDIIKIKEVNDGKATN